MGLWAFLNKPILGTKRRYVFKWREPWLMRLRLHGDFLDRFAMSVACCLAMAAAAYTIAVFERRPPGWEPEVEFAIFMGLCLGAVVSAGIFMLPEAFWCVVTVKEDRLLRERETLGIWAGRSVREWWYYRDLVGAVVPGEALGTPFSVLVLPKKSKTRFALVGVPPRVDLEQVLDYLADRGVKVAYAPELADRVRSQRPYTRPLMVFVVISLLAAAASLSVYGRSEQNRRAQVAAGPRPGPAAGAIPPAAAPVAPAPAAPAPAPPQAPAPPVPNPPPAPVKPPPAPKPKGLVREFQVPLGAASGAFALCPDGKRILGGGRHGEILLWDDGQDAVADDYVPHRFLVRLLAVSPDGRTAVSSDGDQTELWDIPARERIARVPSVHLLAPCVAFSPDGSLLFYPAAGSAIGVYDVAARRARPKLEREFMEIEAMAFTADCGRLAVVTSLGLRYRDPAGQAPDEEIARWPPGVSCRALLPGCGREVGSSKQVAVWDLDKRQPAAKFDLPRNPDFAAVSGDGRTAFMGAGQEVLVWDVRRGTEKKRLPIPSSGPRSRIQWIAATPDGRRVAAYLMPTERLFLWDAAPD